MGWGGEEITSGTEIIYSRTCDWQSQGFWLASWSHLYPHLETYFTALGLILKEIKLDEGGGSKKQRALWSLLLMTWASEHQWRTELCRRITVPTMWHPFMGTSLSSRHIHCAWPLERHAHPRLPGCGIHPTTKTHWLTEGAFAKPLSWILGLNGQWRNRKKKSLLKFTLAVNFFCPVWLTCFTSLQPSVWSVVMST